jgi:hypothetical protein
MSLQAIDLGRICQDCALIVANGEDGCIGPCDHGLNLPASTALGGFDDESEFYVPFRPCPGCGTTLAGTWFEAFELEAGRPVGEAFNDPRVTCCGRDVADCDCPDGPE